MGEIVRRAVQKDIPRLIELGEEFANLSQPIHGFSVSRESIIEFTNDAVNIDRFVVYVLEVDDVIQGLIVGVIEKIYFSKDVALQELAWYVKNGFRGIELFYAFTSCAEQIGCQQVIVGNKPQYYDLTRFYQRQGFHLLENQFAKKIG